MDSSIDRTRVSMTRSSLRAGCSSSCIASRTRCVIGREDVDEDAGVERALVRKMVVDHRLVDAGTAGDAIDGRGGETVGAELVARGGENALSGVRRRGFRAGH